jgi:hypothetical protein
LNEGDFMKYLLTNFAAGWDINLKNLNELKNDLGELGAIDILFYKSEFSLLSTLFYLQAKITHSEPSEASKSNHVDFLLDKKVIARFVERFQGFSGILFEENIPESLQKKIEDVLGKHGYYTGRSAWKYARRLPLICLTCIGLSCLILILTIVLSNILLVSISSLHAVFWIWYYLRIFSK